MPSKKLKKAAKKVAKAIAKKESPKSAARKKVVRPPTKPAASKVKVKPNKSSSKFPAAKPAAAKPAAKASAAKVPVSKLVTPKPTVLKPTVLKPTALKPAVLKPAVAKPAALKAPVAKAAPIKFDTRPLVMPRAAASDEDGDAESPTSAGLLAGPRNVKPYIARRGEQYMNKEQLEHFARILQNWKRDLMVEVDRTVLHMKDEAANFPDPNDRATQEEEFSLELRTRDRERKLIRKIDEALKRIEDGSYGYCLETGEEIGIKRLEARPVATLSVEAQERRERREKQYGDRDDRYR
jgi:DnaK suppressor protein